jgi:hypothetical protein
MCVLSVAAVGLGSCDGKPDNPCPMGKLPVGDTLFAYNDAYYDKPSRFILFPKTALKLLSGDGAAFVVKGPSNLLSRIGTYQSMDSISLDFEHCIFKYDIFDITIRAENIEYVSVTDSSILDISDTYTSGHLQIRTEGHTTGHVRGQFGALDMTNHSTMGLQVEASMDKFILRHGGQGDVDARAATPAHAWIWLNGPGNVYLPEMDTIHATVNGEGTVFYLGDPYLDTLINGKGSVKKLE